MEWLYRNILDQQITPIQAINEYKIPRSVLYRKLQQLKNISKKVETDEYEKNLAFMIAAHIYRSMSKKKNRSVPTEIAISELERIGALKHNEISVSRTNELMRHFGISRYYFTLPPPCIRMQTIGPNMLHEADFTVSQMFYLHNVQIKFHSEYTKKEPKKKVMIGALKDHFSQCVFAKGYQMEAESTGSVIRFLHDAWIDKSSVSFPFHGIPWQLYTDAGPGWKAKACQTLYKSLYISWKPHSPGNPRATGSIEKAIDNLITFEKIIKGRLCLGANISLEDFNRMLFEYCIDTNNKKHTIFKKQKRFEVWQEIKDEEIRQCPPIDVFIKLTATEEHPRKVTPYGTIKYQGKEFYVSTDLVHETVYPYQDLHGHVYIKTKNCGTIGPVKENIPYVIYGAEYKSPPLTEWEKNIRQVKDIAKNLGFSPDDIEYERQTDEMYIPRSGRPIIDKDSEKFFSSVFEAKSYLAESIDFNSLEPEITAQIDDVLETNTDDKGLIPITVVDEILKLIQQ